MRFSKAKLSIGAMALLASLGTTHAGAQATFGTVAGSTSDAFSFGSSFGTSGNGTTTPFTFSVNSTNGPLVFGGTTVSGLFTLSGTAGTATSLGSPGHFIETVTDVSESITSGANTLVSTSGQTGYLIGYATGKVEFVLGGSNLFSSDYYTLSGKQSEVLNFSTASTPTVTAGTLSSFNGTLTSGAFRSSSVPEASTLIGLGGLVLGGGFFGLRRRKA
jgi:hypothetical protein